MAVTQEQILRFELQQLCSSLERDARHMAKELTSFADSCGRGDAPYKLNPFEFQSLSDRHAVLVSKQDDLRRLLEDKSAKEST